MIGTIRKHSKWLWGIIATLTIISFLWWGAAPASRNSGGRAGDLGSIAGRKVSADEYAEAEREVYIYHWFRYHQWPDRNPNFTTADLRREIYVRLLLLQAGRDLGIHIGDEVVAMAAKEILSAPGLAQALGLNSQSVPLNAFVKGVLQQKGLGAADFENFVRDDLVIDQLRQAKGMSGGLITPQEVAAVYRRQNQELSADIVFFSASNYLASVPVTPTLVGQFYTNYLAAYRLPDRVQVHYVAFPVTNFIAAAEQKLTNINEQVDAIYSRYGTNVFPDVSSPEDAKQKIRDALIHEQAILDAREQADAFAGAVFNEDPVRPENLETVARQKGLAVHLTAPFSQKYGPDEFTAPEAFVKAAFGLTPDEPLAGPIIGRDAIYVIALAKQLPSEIPPLDRIRDQVTRDYQFREGLMRAQEAGTNFDQTLQAGMASGKSFSSLCTAAGLRAEMLPPFSLSTPTLPELGDRAGLNQLKSVAFATPVGNVSDFAATAEGGFIVHVKAQLPIDMTAMSNNLPQFTASLRQQLENVAFNNWLERTGSRDLRNTPIAPEQSGGAAQ
jgi:parvulin-like peptidyl-prolyl isomerase